MGCEKEMVIMAIASRLKLIAEMIVSEVYVMDPRSSPQPKRQPRRRPLLRRPLQRRLCTTVTSCIPGYGSRRGKGYKDYCCKTQADCWDDCVRGKCTGPKKSTTTNKTTTKKPSTTTTISSTTATTTETPTITLSFTTTTTAATTSTSTILTTTTTTSTTTTTTTTTTTKPSPTATPNRHYFLSENSIISIDFSL